MTASQNQMHAENAVVSGTTHLGGQYAGVPHWVPVVACDTGKIVQDRSFSTFSHAASFAQTRKSAALFFVDHARPLLRVQLFPSRSGAASSGTGSSCLDADRRIV